MMSGEVPGWPLDFRGSRAVAAGLVTRDRLRGPRFDRVLPDIYVRALTGEPDLLWRSLAAYRLVEGRGVLSGWSAALLLGVDCAPRPDVAAEVSVLGTGLRSRPGLVVHRDRLPDGEICRVDRYVRTPPPCSGDVRCTSPLRTAYDLGRRGDLVDRVVAVDALANRFRFAPDLLLNFAVHYLGQRGSGLINETLSWANRYAGSPMETRLRLLVERAGLPRLAVQWVVPDPLTRTALWLDLAWPDIGVGIEYEGDGHTSPAAVRRDIARYTRLVDQGWRIYRYTKDDIRRPDRIVAELTRVRRHG